MDKQQMLNHIRMSWGLQPIDPWVVVGRTTIDGVAEDIADALGMATASHLAENVDAMIRDGATVKVGGRTVRPREWKRIDADFCLLACDIVRCQSEIDAERIAAELRVKETWLTSCGYAAQECKPTCPECGPHGNRGRVVLAFSEVACTVCAGGVPGDAFGTVESESDEVVGTLAVEPTQRGFDIISDYKRAIAIRFTV